jgi:hypothetical protein
MRPEVDATLMAVVERLVAEVQPALPTSYGQSNLAMMAMLLAASAEQWDGAAAWRAEENASIRRIFRTAAPVVAPALADRLRAAAAAPDPGLRISALNAENDALRALLIELHAAVEETEGAEARRVEQAIWSELAEGCRRRQLHSVVI